MQLATMIRVVHIFSKKSPQIKSTREVLFKRQTI